MHNYILASSDDKILLGKLTDKNHLLSLQISHPADCDRKIYSLYKQTGVFSDKYIDLLYKEEPVIATAYSNPSFGVEQKIEKWTGRALDKELNPINLAIYSVGGIEDDLKWEPLIEQEMRVKLFRGMSDDIKFRIRHYYENNMSFTLKQQRVKNQASMTWGYIAGRRSPFGCYSSSMHSSCNKFHGYEIWMSYNLGITISL